MLEELHVRDLALIEDVWLEFGPGMTALTGETGAGKTALVEALTLLLGERADSTMVRAGASETVVEGRFLADGRETVARRRVSAEGRSKCVLDGEMATVGALEEALGPLVDLHGQHEHQALLSPARHAGYLDRFVGTPAETALVRYREAFDALASARASRDALAEAQADRDARLDRLRFQIADIDGVAPAAGEDDELERRLPSLRHAEKLTEAVSAAFEDVRGDEGSADRLGEAVAALARVRGLDPALDSLAADLEEVAVGLDDACGRLRDYADGIEHDPRALDEAESRMAALAGLKKKYGPALEEVLAARERAAAELEALESGEQGLAEAEARVAEARGCLESAGADLSRVRREAAPGFERLLAEAAIDLAMPGAAFSVAFAELASDAWTREGPERVEFLFSGSGGEAPRPLARIASGGEVSRVMLALKGVLGAADNVPVLVFDEVDAGIGGATAHAVGRRLAELAREHQVLVVTHLAQVAAYAGRQVVVAKDEREGRTVTAARVVEGDERVLEIARMLAGGESDASLAHARELLAEAGAGVTA